MTQKRKQQTAPAPISQPDPVPMPEVVPQEGVPLAFEKPASKAMFWRLFGLVAVAGVAVVATMIYLQMQKQISDQQRELSVLGKEVRKDLAQAGGGYSEMIKKDDHNNRLRMVWDTLKELRTDRSDLTTVKERCALLMELYKASEEERRSLSTEVRRLREAKSAAEERDALVREIRLLRERIAQLETGRTKAKVIQANHAEEQQKP